MRNRIAATALACLLPPAGGALGASPPIDPIFADAFDSCRGDPSCWLTIKPAQVDAVAWFDARCNDGTPASYELRPSPTGSHDWVILFEGGGSCDDATLICADRGTSCCPAACRHNGAQPAQHSWITARCRAGRPGFAGDCQCTRDTAAPGTVGCGRHGPQARAARVFRQFVTIARRA